MLIGSEKRYIFRLLNKYFLGYYLNLQSDLDVENYDICFNIYIYNGYILGECDDELEAPLY